MARAVRPFPSPNGWMLMKWIVEPPFKFIHETNNFGVLVGGDIATRPDTVAPIHPGRVVVIFDPVCDHSVEIYDQS